MHRHQAALNEEATTLVVECADRAYRKAFLEFRLKSLGLSEGEYYVLKVFGGAAWLARPEEFPERYKILVEDIQWACEEFKSITKIILKNHHKCLFYRHKVKNSSSDTELARRDVPIAYRNLRPLVPDRIDIQMYYARIINPQGEVDFERIFSRQEDEPQKTNGVLKPETKQLLLGRTQPNL